MTSDFEAPLIAKDYSARMYWCLRSSIAYYERVQNHYMLLHICGRVRDLFLFFFCVFDCQSISVVSNIQWDIFDRIVLFYNITKVCCFFFLQSTSILLLLLFLLDLILLILLVAQLLTNSISLIILLCSFFHIYYTSIYKY